MPYSILTDIKNAVTEASVIQLADDTGLGGVSYAVSGATNAAPIEITTLAAHGYANGDWVSIRDVLGNTAANGAWIVTVTGTTKFTLTGSAGNGAYTSGGSAIKLSDKVDAAIAAADELINGFLRGRYTLPLASTPPLLKDLSVDIAVYKLYDRRFSANMPDSIRAKYDNAVKLLVMVQKGTVELGVADPAETDGGGSYQTNKTSDDRTFTKDVLDSY
jgi:phage gp36-like protein